MQRIGIPLKADLTRYKNPWLERSIAASAIAVATGPITGGAAGLARKMWGDGDVVDLVLKDGAIAKAAVVPTSTGTAGALAVAAVGDYVTSLQAISAGAKLITAAPRVSLTGVSSITVPARSGAIPNDDALWVAEGEPLPVAQFSLANSATLVPKKLCVQSALTRELATYSAGESVISQMMRESTAMALDSSMFSTAAATSARPAGILNGVAPLTATAPGAGIDEMAADLAKLQGAIAVVTSGLVIVAHPIQAGSIRLRMGGNLSDTIQVWPTIGVAAGTVIALDPAAFVSGFSAEPEIKVSSETLVHMEEALPLPVVGTAGTVAAPLRSAWQTDVLVIKLVLRAAWAWRVPGAVAWVQSATWGG